VPKKLTDVTVPLLLGVPNAVLALVRRAALRQARERLAGGAVLPGLHPDTHRHAARGEWLCQRRLRRYRDGPPAARHAEPGERAIRSNVLVKLPLTELIYAPWDPATNTGERTFEVDYLNNATGLPPSDGIPDSSGANAFPLLLQNPIVFRDVARQAAIDFVVLAKSLGRTRPGRRRHRRREHVAHPSRATRVARS
jgi:hypothetical protein